MSFYIRHNKQSGFTLIELLVSIFVFSILITIIFDFLNHSIRIQKYSLDFQQSITQATYAIEQMVNSIKLAKRDNKGVCVKQYTNFSGNGLLKDSIEFLNIDDKCEVFGLEDGKIYREIAGTSDYLTSDRLEVSKLQFYISGDEEYDNLQPKVTIYLEIKPKNNISSIPPLRFQTTISKRILDVEDNHVEDNRE